MRSSRPVTSRVNGRSEVGDRVEIGGRVGTVRAVEPLLGERELHLIVQLWREGVEP
jgi:hypothetical protein